MVSWQDHLRYNPISPLLSTKNIAINYFVRRDLLEQKGQPVEFLWKLPEVEKILKKQQDDGSWKYHGKKDVYSQENYNQLETYRQIGNIIEKYGFTKKHPKIEKAVEFLFSFQTEEGDFRGIYGTQYSPNYSAAIMELLIKAGYEDDPRIEKGFAWLLSIRQDDGGWVIPMRTYNVKWSEIVNSKEILLPIRKKPFSHLVTGIVLRAFAAHPLFRKTNEAKIAGNLLVSKLFEKDNYRDRGNKEYWEKVSFPFWFTDILSALDALYFLGFTKNHPKVKNALSWLKERQMENGLWDLKLLRTKDKDLPLWIALVICRIVKNFH